MCRLIEFLTVIAIILMSCTGNANSTDMPSQFLIPFKIITGTRFLYLQIYINCFVSAFMMADRMLAES